MHSTKPCRSILVVCEGNICRSPIAEGLLRDALAPGIRVASAGLAAREGNPPEPEAVRLMAGRNLDISGHRSRQLTRAMALSADLILVMDQAQVTMCCAVVPVVQGRVFLLGHWRRPGPMTIVDPYQRGPEAFQAAFEAIDQCVSDWVQQLHCKRRSA